MNYNLSAEDKKKVKNQFSAWLEIQDEKKELSEAEKATKETVKDVLDCNLSQVGKLFKLMQKYYNGSAEDEEDIWNLLELITSPNNSDVEEVEEES